MVRKTVLVMLFLTLPVLGHERERRSIDDLACMSWPELEALYRTLEPGCTPNGFARGKVIYCPCERGAKRKSHAADFFWKGKVFCAEDCTLVNKWAGFKCIKARIYQGDSWLDGKPSQILDYQGMSHVWNDVRDEMRQVCPGVYLGAMYLRRCPEPHLKVYFALESACH